LSTWPENWKGQVPSRKPTTNWVSSLLVRVLAGNDETRRPSLMTFPPPSVVRTRKSDLVGLDHLTDTVRREKTNARILPFF
jgi:hypothetical protein